MDSSLVITKDLIDAKSFIDMGLGVGDYGFHGVEIRGSGADIGTSARKTSTTTLTTITTPTTTTTVNY